MAFAHIPTNVSHEYLHRYLWQFDFVWNSRKMNDGDFHGMWRSNQQKESG